MVEAGQTDDGGAEITPSATTDKIVEIDILNEGSILNVTLLTIYGETNVSRTTSFG